MTTAAAPAPKTGAQPALPPLPPRTTARLNGWGMPIHTPSLCELHRSMQRIVAAGGPHEASQWFNREVVRFREPGIGQYSGEQMFPVMDDGSQWCKAYYFLLPCKATVALVVPKCVDLSTQHITLYATDSIVAGFDTELEALVRCLCGYLGQR